MNENQIRLNRGRTKNEIVKETKKNSDKMLIRGHPMTGKAKKEEACRPELFSGKPFFRSFGHRFSRKGKSVIKDILYRIGAIPLAIDPDGHDLPAPNTSHLPYVISLVLFKTFLDSRLQDKRIDRFVSTGFLGAPRLVLTSPLVVTDILLTNKNHFLPSLNRVIEELARFSERVDQDNFSETIRKIYFEAERRRKLDENASF